VVGGAAVVVGETLVVGAAVVVEGTLVVGAPVVVGGSLVVGAAVVVVTGLVVVGAAVPVVSVGAVLAVSPEQAETNMARTAKETTVRLMVGVSHECRSDPHWRSLSSTWTANTCTRKLRTRLGGVFAVLPVPCGDWGLVEVGVEASPDKWGRFHTRARP